MRFDYSNVIRIEEDCRRKKFIWKDQDLENVLNIDYGQVLVGDSSGL